MSGRGGGPDTPRDAPEPSRGRLRRITAAVLVAIAYYAGAQVGLGFALVTDRVTPLWPPTGVALVGFLLAGRSVWPAVALAAFAVNLPISDGPLAAAMTAIGNTLAPLVAATLLRRVGFRRQLDRRTDAVALVFLAALASMVISASIGAGTLLAFDEIASEELLDVWAVWWTGDAMGILVVGPFLLSLPLFWERRDWTWSRWAEAAVNLVIVALVASWAANSDMHLLFLTLPVLGWASWRLQLRGAAPAALTASLIVTWAAAHDRGPFNQGSLLERMLNLQAFNASMALTSFVLAALVSERMRAAAALQAAATELEERVRLRTAELSAANDRLRQEIRERSEAQEQLSREEARSRKERYIAETLQRSMLQEHLPEIPGVQFAARYVPATADIRVGGDWYDVVELPGGLIGLAIGDVAGHGLQAAAAMSQLRMALRVYALQDPSPPAVMAGVHQLVAQLSGPEMVTLLYMVFDPHSGALRFTNAGHPPALVVHDGTSRYLTAGLGPPVGASEDGIYAEARLVLPAGTTLVLYTDGLVERRGVSIQDGLDRLQAEATSNGADVEELCERLLAALVVEDESADDIALIAMRPVSVLEGMLDLAVPAELGPDAGTASFGPDAGASLGPDAGTAPAAADARLLPHRDG